MGGIWWMGIFPKARQIALRSSPISLRIWCRLHTASLAQKRMSWNVWKLNCLKTVKPTISLMVILKKWEVGKANPQLLIKTPPLGQDVETELWTKMLLANFPRSLRTLNILSAGCLTRTKTTPCHQLQNVPCATEVWTLTKRSLTGQSIASWRCETHSQKSFQVTPMELLQWLRHQTLKQSTCTPSAMILASQCTKLTEITLTRKTTWSSTTKAS